MSEPALTLDAARATMPPPAPKATGTPGQTESLDRLWTSTEGTAGIWECSPGTFTSRKAGETEVCQVLSGRATVSSDDGSVVEIAAGSLVVLPDGWSGSWQVHETIRKSFISISTSSNQEG